jgi:hypothetical protein
VESIDNHELPLVTADDDVIYPKDWLLRLYDAHRSEPDTIHCHWAMRITLEDQKIMPYLQWQKVVRSREASFLNFALGVQGVIYPPSFLNCLHTAGKAFQDTCPKADDIWLHVTALRNGYKVKTISENHSYFDLVPHTQDNALWASNMLPGGNDAQISRTYGADDIRSLLVYAQQAHPS